VACQGMPTICRICKENCGIVVSDDGKGVTVSGNPQHPISRGFVCFKGKNFPDVRNSPDRLRRPLLRKGNDWEETTFYHAMDLLASQFVRLKNQYGPESVVVYKGESLKHQEIAEYLKHLTFAFGSPNYISVGSLCHYAMVLGHSLTYGGMAKLDFNRVKSVMLWGTNPAAASPHVFAELRRAVRDGLSLVVIDPAQTQSTQMAGVHLPITPGTDGFLALAFVKYGIEAAGVRHDPETAVGWHRLAETARGQSYDQLLARTGVTAKLFEQAASLIFSQRPGCCLTGLGLELQPAGVQAIRAVACLQTMLDPDNRPSPISIGLNALPQAGRYPQMKDPIGFREAPLFTQSRKEGQGMHLARAILDSDPYPVKGMFVAGGNPMSTFPAPEMHGKAFAELEFLAVSDLFMTPTARLADLVIPAADYLDNLELHDYGMTGSAYLSLIQPVTRSPIGWPVWRIVFEVAERLGLKDYFPWKDNRSALDYRLNGCQIDLSQLETHSAATLPYQTKTQPGGKWNTPDGKAHLYSERVAQLGLPGLPTPDSLELPYRTDEHFPLWLSTGDRVLAFQHSQFRQIESFRDQVPEPMLDLHPRLAAQLKLESGDTVVVSTRYGRLQVKAHVTEDVREDCVRLPHGWEDANANQLTGLEHFDPISGFPWLRAIPARVEKKENGQ